DNPIANQFLNQFGWLGLGIFKVTTVLVVIAITSIVARQRPRTARHVLRFACAAAAYVVLHGASIDQTATTSDESQLGINEYLALVHGHSQKRGIDSFAYCQQVAGVCEDIVSGKSTLARAVDILESSELTQDPLRRKAIATCHLGKSFRESLALQIIDF